ncbi:MAG: hypothetical protein ACTSRS_18950 [Candidatus Helarchaeota archaeon]
MLGKKREKGTRKMFKNSPVFEYAIHFSRDYQKLQAPIFTTIRLKKSEHYYREGRIYKIYVNENYMGKALILVKRERQLDAIPLALIEFDTDGATREAFFRMMARFYSRRREWRGCKTCMYILFLLWVEHLPL